MTSAILFAAVALVGVFGFLAYYFAVLHPRRGTLDWIARQERAPFTLARPRHPMGKKDALPVLLITLLYAATAFFQLGSLKAPQSWVDFGETERVTVSLAQPVTAAGLRCYSGLGVGVEHSDKRNSAYQVEISADGTTWLALYQAHDDPEKPEKITGYYWGATEGYAPSYALTQTYQELFKWRDLTLDNPQPIRYLRLYARENAQSPLELGKLLLLDEAGEPMALDWQMEDSAGAPAAVAALLAVDETVPQAPDWTNSTYFDEIYHARTAKEHLDGVRPYEWTHPPLGKLIIGVGVRLFGMTPFGWRFMGTLFGVLMLPILYIFLKNLFGKTAVAACGTTLFAVDFMHLTQTRIATIDTYGVFFILLAYFFFYRWLTVSATPRRRRERPGEGYLSLALSGLSFGVGCACKWTVIYGGVGLFLLYVVHLVLRFRSWDKGPEAPPRWRWLTATLGVSLLSFVILPLIVYTLSYWPYAVAYGAEVSWESVWRGFGESLPIFWRKLTAGSGEAIPKTSLSSIMVENQWAMFHYHQGVHTPHAFSSRWYQWLLDIRPILYYSERAGEGMIRSFASFNNPILSWAGLGSLIFVAIRTVQRRCGKGFFLVVGFLSQLVPWMLIGRTTFAYHYFPSILFLTLCVAYLFNDLMEAPRAQWRLPVYGLTGGAVTAYLLFYPALTGLSMPLWYAQGVLRWFPSWPIY